MSLVLRKLIQKQGRNYFFLMHLSWGKSSNEAKRIDLWNWARRDEFVGIDYGHPDVNTRWGYFSEVQKRAMSHMWRHQFELFSAMQTGDCVVVANGVTELLGIAIIRGPYEFRANLGEFFRHVRRVSWIVDYEWQDRLRLPIRYWFQGFQNTIQRISPKSDYWKITRYPLRPTRNVLQETRKHDLKKALRKKYGPQGEGQDHKRLKEWVLNHPESIGLYRVENGQREYEFLTGDRVDLMFDLPEDRFAVVEIETDNPDLIMQGAYQALKYRTLKCAEIGCDIKSDRVKAILVAWKQPEDPLFFQTYGIEFVEKEARLGQAPAP